MVKDAPNIPIARPQLPDRDQFMDLVADLYESRMLSNFGKYCRLLEERAAEAIDHPSPRCVASCDVGLVLAWKALGCRSGEVIVPSFTFCSTVNALKWNNLTPVFADIDPSTFCLDPGDVRRRITRKTVGIAATHTYGCPAAIAELVQIARDSNLKLVFDAAHGLGAAYQGQGLGAFGDASAFSLSGTKLVTSGEGGLVTFRDPDATRRFERLRGYGFIGDYNCHDAGLNGKLSELNAGLGWLSLGMLADAADHRREQVRLYVEELSDCRGVKFQYVPKGCVHGYKDLAVRFDRPEDRAAAEQALTDRGVQTKRYFLPVHRMKAYAEFADAKLPVTNAVYERILCLPIFSDLSNAQIRQICRTIRAVVRAGAIPVAHHLSAARRAR
jgi:dTDP-4-amino-4,6-dideoxygalactose transaminase